LLGHAGTSSAPPSPAINGDNMAAALHDQNLGQELEWYIVLVLVLKMRAPMILSGTLSIVSNASVSGAAGGGGGVAIAL
jgi:hypothetical protein